MIVVDLDNLPYCDDSALDKIINNYDEITIKCGDDYILLNSNSIVKMLLTLLPDDKIRYRDDALLEVCCHSGELDLVQIYINRVGKENINPQDIIPFTQACKHNHIHIAKYLMDQGTVDLNRKAIKQILYQVTSVCNRDTITWIIEECIERESVRRSCITRSDNYVLKLAVQNEDVSVLAYLINRVDTLDDRSMCALLDNAYRYGMLVCVKYLMENYAKIKYINLSASLRNPDINVTKYLLVNHNFIPSLHEMRMILIHEDEELVRLLREQQIRLNSIQMN